VAAEESQSRLMQTTLFNRVDITPIDAPQEGVKDVSVEVVEGKSARFIVGAGVSSTSGLIGTISVTERNFDLFRWPRSFRDWVRGQAFKGAGQRFSINAEPGTELNRFYVDWSEPRLFDLRYSLSTRAFLFERERESYDETRYGGVVSVGHRFKNRWYGELATRIESVELDDLESSIAPEIRADADQAVMTGLKVTLVRDRTDSRWQPSRGDRLRLSYEQVLGDYNFGNLYGDYRIYRTLYVDALDRKHILAGRVAAGRILGDAPVYEHYYGGGLGSVRGFKHRGISPRSVANDDPIGGEFMVYAGTEYTFPLIGEQLRGVVFLDTGTVEETFEVVTYRVSAGFGVRWTVAFFGPVPMSLDFGFPIVKDEQDDERIFNFSIGWEF
jgi:outer membrane protein insertion porin family